MDKIIIHPDLEQFLREERILTIFKENVIKVPFSKPEAESIKNADEHTIAIAFAWSRAKIPHANRHMDPFTYWKKISDKWRTMLKIKGYLIARAYTKDVSDEKTI